MKIDLTKLFPKTFGQKTSTEIIVDSKDISIPAMLFFETTNYEFFLQEQKVLLSKTEAIPYQELVQFLYAQKALQFQKNLSFSNVKQNDFTDEIIQNFKSKFQEFEFKYSV